MLLNRRTWLGGLAGLAGAAAVPALGALTPATIVAPGATPAFRAVVDRIAAYAAAELAAYGFPGMTVAVRAADGQAATLALGFADIAARTPVRGRDLFQIGSISKSLVAMAIYRLAGEGRLDLDAPVLTIVPELPLADRSITLAQLLAHSAGLPDNTPPFARVPGDRLWSATPPGAKFSYSNAGYDMLAFVVERASGLPYDQALTRLVLTPLGMTSARAVIRTADRAAYVRGYVPFRGDIAWFPRDRLAEGPWLDIDRAAGSVAATSADMGRYIAFLGRLAKGDGAPLFGPALATRFATPVIESPDFGKGSRYGAGLATIDIDGTPALHHTGGMLVFSSAVTVDRASGAGVFASVNIGAASYRPRVVAKYGVQLLRALASGAALPPAPAIVALAPVKTPSDFAGRFVAPGGASLTVAAAGDGLTLTARGGTGRVKPIGPDSFLSDLAGFDDHVIDFVAATGRRDRLWVGDVLYGRDAAVAAPAPVPAIAALAGIYASNDPWAGGVSIVARGDSLVMEGAGPLARHADGSWRFVEASTERLWFDAVVNGRPQRLSFSGEPLLRTVA